MLKILRCKSETRTDLG